jgi:hypothetical protein
VFLDFDSCLIATLAPEIDSPSTRSARRRTVFRTAAPADKIHRQPTTPGLPCHLFRREREIEIFLMRTGIK